MPGTFNSLQPIVARDVSIPSGKATLEGTLCVPVNAAGIVLFAHGSGSSRHSPRNVFVAQVLQSHDIATLLFDLLTHDEEIIDQRTANLRFDIHLLTKRLIRATHWTLSNADTRGLKLGYFGASTGAAAALNAAAQLQESVAAVVCRGGRPDLADENLGLVRAPTLLIVGERDEAILDLNQQAYQQLLHPSKELLVIPGATHIFEEPGALEEVARVSADWFSYYFSPSIEPQVQRFPHPIQVHREVYHGR